MKKTLLIFISIISIYASSPINSIRFELFQYELTKEHKKYIKKLAKVMKSEDLNIRLLVIPGEIEYSCQNDTLSKLRTENIVKYFHCLNIKEDRISVFNDSVRNNPNLIGAKGYADFSLR